MSSKKKRRRKPKKKVLVSSIRSCIKVPPRKVPFVLDALVRCPIGSSYEELAERGQIGWRKMRDIIEELQLFYHNPKYTLQSINRTDLRYFYPTIAQFRDFSLAELDLALNLTIQKPTTTKVKKNRVLRALSKYVGQDREDLCHILQVAPAFYTNYKQELKDVVETNNAKRILSFGEEAGLYQLTERRGGIVQEVCHAYLHMLNPEISIAEHHYVTTGHLDAESVYGLMRSYKKHLEKMSLSRIKMRQLKTITEKNILTGYMNMLQQTMTVLEMAIFLMCRCTAPIAYKVLGFDALASRLAKEFGLSLKRR